jgi:hypothetical protein
MGERTYPWHDPWSAQKSTETSHKHRRLGSSRYESEGKANKCDVLRAPWKKKHFKEERMISIIKWGNQSVKNMPKKYDLDLEI